MDAQSDFQLKLGVLTSDFKDPWGQWLPMSVQTSVDTEVDWEASKDKMTQVGRYRGRILGQPKRFHSKSHLKSFPICSSISAFELFKFLKSSVVHVRHTE